MDARVTDATEERLAEWVRAALGDGRAAVAWGPPLAASKSPSVSLTLLEILPTPLPRTAAKAPLKLKLRYLITVQAPDPQEAHALLVRLSFSAMDATDWDVELGALPPAAWEALGAPLQPSLVLNVPLLEERPARRISRVRFPMVLETGSFRSITGSVLGPGEIPIMDACVDLPSLGRSARTDAQGRFRLPGVPTKPAPASLRVRAKGVEMSVDLSTTSASGDVPLVIHLNPLEE